MDIPEMVAEHEMAFEPQREAEEEEQPEEYEDEECIMLRRQIYYTSRTPSWTYSPRSGTYDRSLQIFRGTLVRTGSRSRRCSEGANMGAFDPCSCVRTWVRSNALGRNQLLHLVHFAFC
jgi:hypothetical protein